MLRFRHSLSNRIVTCSRGSRVDELKTDFHLLAEYSADIICRVALDMTFIYVSPSSVRVLGWTPEEMVAMTAFGLIYAEDLAAFTAAARRHLAPGVDASLITTRMRKKDASIVWMEISSRVVRNLATGEAREMVMIMRDITARKMTEERLSALALTDALTGLANRRAFDETLDREWRRTLREGSQISLLLLDLDRFKEFNDHYGHQVGDDCLRAVADAVRGAVRATDIAARYGGEEIAVILPATDLAGGVEAAEKVRSAVEALQITHVGNSDGMGWVTVSVGVATALSRIGGTMRMPESLLLAADNALYKAKREGRNQVATCLLMAIKDEIVSHRRLA
jgi:diguanylate cyclase (GGDEF)-like protein/PAS domain S-box-containing protein